MTPDGVTATDRARDRAKTRRLYTLVIIAIALGVVLGLFAPDTGAKMKPFGDAFIKLIKMTIGPLIFCTVVTGIAGMQSMKAVGRAGGLALIYFEVMSTVALVLGLVIVNLIGPGVGMNIDPSKLDTTAIKAFTGAGQKLTFTDFVLDIIPDTMVGAFTRGDLLPVLLVALLAGFALHRAGERCKPILRAVEQIGHIVFGIVGIIMYVAPIGAFGAMAFTVGKYGVGALASLGALMGCFYATCLVFIFVILGSVAKLTGFSIFRFVRYIRDELFIVLGTSSSESVLPRMIAKMETLGASRPVVGLVIPAGYSFNLDGTSIYLTMAAVFVAQATNTPLGVWQQIELLAILVLTSKGAAGVTGSGFIVLAATLGSVGHVPTAGLALIFGIDRFMSEARALTNVIGNGVATLVVAKWCKSLDHKQLTDQLHAPSE